MELVIHRGSKQIGGNIIEIRTDNARIALDCGINLPDLDDQAQDEDDISIEGLMHGKSAFDAVLLSHHHGDHCGLMRRINKDIPIYASAITKEILDVVSDFINKERPRIDHVLKPESRVKVKDIEILPIPVGHSARGALMFLIDSGGKSILYTGDFSRVEDKYFDRFGKVDVLICEGTNIDFDIGMKEEEIEKKMIKLFQDAPSHVFVLCSTTNIDRIQSVHQACIKTGRKMAVDPFAKAVLEKFPEINLDPKNAIGFVPRRVVIEENECCWNYLQKNKKFFRKREVIKKYEKIVFLVRVNYSMKYFLNVLNDLVNLKGTTLIYSIWRGYENSNPTRDFLENCRSLGIKRENLHTSGHIYGSELKEFIERLDPKIIVPVHTVNAKKFKDRFPNTELLDDGERFVIA
ncbi:MAG: MBL fold metallo-hydrolase [Deltaproteobacteria bacterium]|nr:MBL fold metallo-hydrolase [Deltaproteobacteria bacterium]